MQGHIVCRLKLMIKIIEVTVNTYNNNHDNHLKNVIIRDLGSLKYSDHYNSIQNKNFDSLF